MKHMLQTTAVAGCGLITSILTVIGALLISRLSGIDIFTFSIWVVVPIGAILTGAVAASGYYFGSLYFHKRPTLFLFLQMLAIAAFTQILIYYLDYSTIVLDDGVRASQLISFSQYLDISLTKAHYRFGRTLTDTGEVGDFGYWLAVIQFVGFIVGGAFIFLVLLGRTECKKCQKYLRLLAVKKKQFTNSDEFADYYDGIFKHPIDSNEFSEMFKINYAAKTEKNSIALKEELFGCPQCKTQMIANSVQVYNGEEWKNINKLDRKIKLPDTLNLIKLFTT